MQVADAVKVGAQAIKDNHVTLVEVQTCLDEVDEAISQQRETQASLGAISALYTRFLQGLIIYGFNQFHVGHICTD